MNIYILIILCLYTITGVYKTINGIAESDPNQNIAGLIILILGIIAIIFQSTNLNQ